MFRALESFFWSSCPLTFVTLTLCSRWSIRWTTPTTPRLQPPSLEHLVSSVTIKINRLRHSSCLARRKDRTVFSQSCYNHIKLACHKCLHNRLPSKTEGNASFFERKMTHTSNNDYKMFLPLFYLYFFYKNVDVRSFLLFLLLCFPCCFFWVSSFLINLLLEVKFPYDPFCPSVGWLVGRMVCLL